MIASEAGGQIAGIGTDVTVRGRAMVWCALRADPTTNRAAADVLAAYKAASKVRRPFDRYRAGVAAWRRAHPNQTAAYVAQQAAAVILAAKVRLRFEDI